MSPARVAIVLVILASLGAGGVLLAIGSEAEPAAERSQPSDRLTERPSDERDRPVPSDTDVERRLAALEARVQRLERTRIALQQAASDGDDEERDESGNVIDNPVFEAAVRDVVDRVEGEQEQVRQERRMRRMAAWAKDSASELAESLSLDEAQRAKVQALLKEHFERIIAERESGRADGGSSRRERFLAAREELDSKIDAVLTPAQRRQATALRENGEFPGTWGGRRGRRR